MGLKTQKYPVFSVQKYHFGGGCPYFSLTHKSTKYTFVQQEVGGPKTQKYVQMCIHVCTFVPWPPPPDPDDDVVTWKYIDRNLFYSLILYLSLSQEENNKHSQSI